MEAADLDSVRIVTPTRDAMDVWLALRARLFEDLAEDQHLREIEGLLADPTANAAFLAYEGEAPVGLVEVSIRDRAEGCDTHGVGYIEGIYVAESARRGGVASALYDRAEAWARDRGAREMASDVRIGNDASMRWHGRQGFEEVDRVVLLRKSLDGTV